jgi:hypothetical protein
MSVVIKGNSNINLDFSTGGRITGDFSNATLVNRVMFQNSVTNGPSNVQTLPNGTGTTAGFLAFANSDPANTNFAQIAAVGLEARVSSGITGTGTYAPMTFYTGGSERLRIDTSGNVGIGTIAPATKLDVAGGYVNLRGTVVSGSSTNNANIVFDIRNSNNQSKQSYIYGLADGTDTGSFITFGTCNTNTTSERMRITSGGNLGIGTSAPAGKLHVAGGNAGIGNVYLSGRSDSSFEVNVSNIWARNENANFDGARIKFDVSSSNGLMMFHTATGGSLVERMRITSAGDLLVGTTSAPKSWGAASPKMRVTAGGIQFGDYSLITEDVFDIDSLCLVADSTESICFGQYVNATGVYTERGRFDASGNLLVARTSTVGGARLSVEHPTDCIGLNLGPSASGARYLMYFMYNNSTVGSITSAGTTTAYNTSSDYRLKHDIQPMTGALAKVAQLKPVTYKWNADDSQSQGFIAHELAEVVPDAVTGEKDAVDAEGKPQYQGIDTSFLVATLTAAIQEQQTMIEQLKADVAALKESV